MKIGVTGGTGFIGQYLVREFCNEHEFVVITSRSYIEGLFQNENVTYITENYDQEGFEKAFLGCDGVVHLGAKRSNKELEQSVTNYFDNIRISDELFCACEAIGIKNVVNISSTAVYDTTTEYPFEEKNAPKPLSNYGVAKLAIENMAHLFNKKKNMNIKSLRLAQVMGYGERGGYMLAIFLERCLNQEPLNVFGKGAAGREYVYVKDVVYAIICALNVSDKSGVYNIGMGTLTTNLELAKEFCAVFENEAGYKLLDKPEVVEHYLMDNKLAKQELGFCARYSVHDALVDMKQILQEM